MHGCCPLGDSDRNTIYFNICDFICGNIECETAAPTITVNDFKAADFMSLNNYLSAVNWQEILANTHDVQDMWAIFTAVLDDAIDMFVPTSVVKLNRRTNLRSYPKHIRRYFSKDFLLGVCTGNFTPSP